MDTIVDLLRAIRERYKVAMTKGDIHIGKVKGSLEYYCIYDPDLPHWFDATRVEVIQLQDEN